MLNNEEVKSLLNLIEDINKSIENIKRSKPKKRNLPILETFFTPYTVGQCDHLLQDKPKEVSAADYEMKFKRG